jgi:(p)ppGpp synthase/HD superfamily hydrolase
MMPLEIGDDRVIYVELVDHIHNMRTIETL